MSDGEDCAICSGPILQSDTLCKLTCDHEFHVACIQQWFFTSKKICPLCRFEPAECQHEDAAPEHLQPYLLELVKEQAKKLKTNEQELANLRASVDILQNSALSFIIDPLNERNDGHIRSTPNVQIVRRQNTTRTRMSMFRERRTN